MAGIVNGSVNTFSVQLSQSDKISWYMFGHDIGQTTQLVMMFRDEEQKCYATIEVQYVVKVYRAL